VRRLLSTSPASDIVGLFVNLPEEALAVLAGVKKRMVEKVEREESERKLESLPKVGLRAEKPRLALQTRRMRKARVRGQAFQRMCQRRECGW
jgi:hypothetical protein